MSLCYWCIVPFHLARGNTHKDTITVQLLNERGQSSEPFLFNIDEPIDDVLDNECTISQNIKLLCICMNLPLAL